MFVLFEKNFDGKSTFPKMNTETSEDEKENEKVQ